MSTIMNWFHKFYEANHFIVSLVVAFLVLGLIGLWTLSWSDDGF